MMLRMFFYLFLLTAIPFKTVLAQDKKENGKSKKEGHDDEEEPYCLEVSGTLYNDKKTLNKLDIVIYCDGKVDDNYNTAQENVFKAGFKKNKLYTLVIKKTGMLPLVIIVSTQMPPVKKEKFHRFFFETEMKPIKNNFNPEYTDYPAAYIRYIPSETAFNISQNYNTFIKTALKSQKE